MSSINGSAINETSKFRRRIKGKRVIRRLQEWQTGQNGSLRFFPKI